MLPQDVYDGLGLGFNPYDVSQDGWVFSRINVNLTFVAAK